MGLQYTEPPSSLPRGGPLVLLAWLLPKVLVEATTLVPKVTNPGVWSRLLPWSSLLKWCAQVLLLRSRTCKHVTGYRISAAAAQTEWKEPLYVTKLDIAKAFVTVQQSLGDRLLPLRLMGHGLWPRLGAFPPPGCMGVQSVCLHAISSLRYRAWTALRVAPAIHYTT